MKWSKRMVCFFVSLVIGVVCTAPISSYAVEVSFDDDELIQEQTVVSERFIDPTLVGTVIKPLGQENQIIPFNVYGEKQVLRATYVKYETVNVRPIKQPENGYKGGSGAWITFFESGGDTHEFTVTIDFKVFKFTTKTGTVNSSGIGYSAQVPSDKKNYFFEFVKDYTIRTRKYDVYKYNIYQYSYYIQDAKYSLGHEWVGVKNESK